MKPITVCSEHTQTDKYFTASNISTLVLKCDSPCHFNWIRNNSTTNPIRLLSESLIVSLESHCDTQGYWWLLSINLTGIALPNSGRGVEVSEDIIKLREASSLLCPRDQSLGGPSCGAGWHLCASIHLCVPCDCDELTVITITVRMVTSGPGDHCFAWSLPSHLQRFFHPSHAALEHYPWHTEFCLATSIHTDSSGHISLGHCNPHFCPTEALSSLKAG